MAFVKKNLSDFSRTHHLPFPLNYVNNEILGRARTSGRGFLLIYFDHRETAKFVHQLSPPIGFAVRLVSKLTFFRKHLLCLRQFFADVL